jgi:hypothetical protein
LAVYIFLVLVGCYQYDLLAEEARGWQGWTLYRYSIRIHRLWRLLWALHIYVWGVPVRCIKARLGNACNYIQMNVELPNSK